MPQKDLEYKVFNVANTFGCPAFIGEVLIRANAAAGAFAVTLPSAQSAEAGTKIKVIKTDASANAITIATTSTAGVTLSAAQTINGASGDSLSSQYAQAEYESNGGNWEKA